MGILRTVAGAALRPFGYEVRKVRGDRKPGCDSVPAPSAEVMRAAEGFFRNSFPLSPKSGMTREQMLKEAEKYFWHYPFELDGTLLEADKESAVGLKGRHRQRYFHFFPPLLERTGGSLKGKSVLDIACNAGFWSMQARLAGADRVLGIEAGEGNVEHGKFLLKVSGLDGIEYRVGNAYDVRKESLGQFDVTFFLGLLYHLDRPVEALERLREVTKPGGVAVVDTSLSPLAGKALEVRVDTVHEQNFSNRLCLFPSLSSVAPLLKHAGFREVYYLPKRSGDLPRDYLHDSRATWFAIP